MRQKQTYLYWLFIVLSANLLSCSTQKNTWASRTFHQTKTKYNIYHNGYIAFNDGLKAIDKANEDDYSTVLNLYPVSNHAAAEASRTQMDRTIEKCRKCIKLHSIKARPKVNHDKKRSNPRYALWLEQEEFNNQIGNAWLLLGMAEFHKGDFLGSISTFNYIIRHYASDVDMVGCCQLWIARAYAEMGWLYEADDMLNKVRIDDLSRKHSSLYALVSADVLLKQRLYKDAIPFLKLALPSERRTEFLPRHQYVLAQLYHLNGDKELARTAYKKVIKLQASNDLDFNARLRLAQLDNSTKQAIKSLMKMAGLEKNKDQLDMIYGAIGDLYLAKTDTLKCLKFYEKAISESVHNGMSKARVLIQAGDIYYQQRDYMKASPCYREASQIISADNEQYARVQRRSETLDELVVEYSVVQLQDSLQALARLSEAEQRVVVDSIIARLIRAEQEEKEREAQQAREAENNAGPRGVNTANMLGGGTGSWYFYNPQLLRSGKQTFRTQWGNRILEDNWRRMSKAAVMSFPEEYLDEDEPLLSDSASTDSLKVIAAETDTHKPEYYLQQIPKTKEDIEVSNELIASALYNMVYIYRDRVGDKQLSDETFNEFRKRFPNHKLLLDLYYMQYLTALKVEDKTAVERYKQYILQEYPESKEAQIVSQPDYFDRLRAMSQEQDSIYEDTYQAFLHNNFSRVKLNKRYAEENYPLSPLMPRFMLLNAVAVAKTDGQQAFVYELQDIVERYSNHEMGAMAKNMLALLGQGAKATKSQVNSLKDLREQAAMQQQTDSVSLQFSNERNTTACVLFVHNDGENLSNQLLFEIALFNFSHFMIKDFDLRLLPSFDGNNSVLLTSGFEGMSEAEWYFEMLSANSDIKSFLDKNGIRVICITQTNLDILGSTLTIQDYLDWNTQR
jgi:tetratricopeptide (TPR) repeat protein